MKIFCCSDIHGFINEFEKALSLIIPHLGKPHTMLCLLGDYIHGGSDNYGVLDKIMNLQDIYGTDKVLALMGTHEKFILSGDSTINHLIKPSNEICDSTDDKYIAWMKTLPLYYVKGKTIFVHAGIEEDVGELWSCFTSEETFIGKYPAETGKIKNLDKKVVAGHIGTAEISGDPNFHNIYYDGTSHYYIDGTVLDSGIIPVIMVDTDTDKYYRVTDTGNQLIFPYI